jgi:hypothetical protein
MAIDTKSGMCPYPVAMDGFDGLNVRWSALTAKESFSYSIAVTRCRSLARISTRQIQPDGETGMNSDVAIDRMSRDVNPKMRSRVCR